MIKLTQIVHGDQSAPNLYFVKNHADDDLSGLYRAHTEEEIVDLLDIDELQITQIATFENRINIEDLSMQDLRILIQDAQNLLSDKAAFVSRSRRVIYIKPNVSGKGVGGAEAREAKRKAKQKEIDDLEALVAELEAKVAQLTQNQS